MSVVQQRWIKIGKQDKDLFQILDLFKQGLSIYEITKLDNSLTETDIKNLLLRTIEYLKSHLILDSYLETVSQLSVGKMQELKLEWTDNEIKELLNLHACGANIENISQLMRKNILEIQNKLFSFNLLTERN